MHQLRVLAACALTVALAAGAVAAPYPRAETPRAVDLGPVTGAAAEQPITVTVPLKLQDPAGLEALLTATYTPGSPQYRRFLTTAQFAERFAPSAATIARVTHHFEAAGLAVSRSATSQLQVTGTARAIHAEFGVELHTFEVPATARTSAYRYRAPTAAPQVAAEIADAVHGVVGLDSRPRLRPNLRQAGPLRALRRQLPAAKGSAPATTDPPGDWTVTDFAQYYDVVPLYQNGIDGHGQTVGIMTFASFTPSDAFAYWNSLGLKVRPDRIRHVPVDGGSGPPSDEAGSDETTLDVEQSGGLSPGARIVVYEAPNTNQGFVDVFATAVDQNAADTMSISWGEWEYLDLYDASNPVTGGMTTALQAVNDVLIQAAIQGQSVFAAAGDAGAYDANDPQSIYPVPQFTRVLSVDDPAAQPFITAAGGTTLPGPQYFLLPSGATYELDVAYERAWGWDYLIPLCTLLGYDPVSCGIFPAGGGGGVSSQFTVPFYQWGVPGVATTQPGQRLVDTSQTPPQLILKLPAYFPGRNVPDISVNSDPDTGYILYYTSDQTGFGISDFWGGTSFAAPQLNGVTSLLDQTLGGRVGLLNFPLYNLVRANRAYGGAKAPLRDIVHGTNWFYAGMPGYDPATGVGVPDVANLARALRVSSY
jgi:subtilase family serine protease